LLVFGSSLGRNIVPKRKILTDSVCKVGDQLFLFYFPDRLCGIFCKKRAAIGRSLYITDLCDLPTILPSLTRSVIDEFGSNSESVKDDQK